ncbi:MAG: Excinuclease ATPase subunit [Caulobacter sp.]|nr:Excinuclease ATPase subunit [Caulobacter sp.]
MRLKLMAAAAVMLAVAAPAGMAASAAKGAPGQGDVLVYALQRAAEDPEVAAKLAPGVKLYFGDQPAKVVSEIGKTETNRVGVRPARRIPISPRCIRVAGNALISLSEDAKTRGGNAVVGIRSNYNGKAPANSQQFECVLGLQMLTVSLTGTVAVVE